MIRAKRRRRCVRAAGAICLSVSRYACAHAHTHTQTHTHTDSERDGERESKLLAEWELSRMYTHAYPRTRAHTHIQVQADVLLASRITEEEKAELLKECRIKDKHHTGLLSVEDFMDTIRGKLYAMANSDIMDLVTLCQSDPRDFSGEVDYERFFDAIFEALAADRQRKEEKKQSRAGNKHKTHSVRENDRG